MKRFLILMAFCAVIDFLTPDAQTHAQVMIAPAVIAAIIGAIGSLIGGAMGGKPKNEGIALQKGSFGGSSNAGGAAGGSGGMAGAQSFDLPGIMGEIGPLMAPDGGGGRMQQPLTMDGGGGMPKYNEKIAEVNAGAPPAADVGFRPITGTPPQRQSGGFDLGLGGDAGGVTSGRDGMTLGSVDMTGGQSSTKSGFDADKTLQYAAMAAALGSLLNSGKPPNPPSLPGGGSFNAQPTSMRFLYGG